MDSRQPLGGLPGIMRFLLRPAGGSSVNILSSHGVPLSPADTSALGTDILLMVVEWLYKNRCLPCISNSSAEFRTLLAAWGELEEFIHLSELYLDPSKLLEYPLLFLGGWAEVQGVTHPHQPTVLSQFCASGY